MDNLKLLCNKQVVEGELFKGGLFDDDVRPVSVIQQQADIKLVLRIRVLALLIN